MVETTSANSRHSLMSTPSDNNNAPVESYLSFCNNTSSAHHHDPWSNSSGAPQSNPRSSSSASSEWEGAFYQPSRRQPQDIFQFPAVETQNHLNSSHTQVLPNVYRQPDFARQGRSDCLTSSSSIHSHSRHTMPARHLHPHMNRNTYQSTLPYSSQIEVSNNEFGTHTQPFWGPESSDAHNTRAGVQASPSQATPEQSNNTRKKSSWGNNRKSFPGRVYGGEEGIQFWVPGKVCI